MKKLKPITNKVLWTFAVGQFGWSLLSGIIATWLVHLYTGNAEKFMDTNGILSQFISQTPLIASLTLFGIITAVGRLFDAETAWMLFGASDVAGMTVSIGGAPYVVAGVYEHEKDAFSRHAADGGMRIYMSYEAYRRSKPDSEKPAVTCYEFVMAEPVRGFAYSAASEKFPVSGAVLIENGRRFEAGNLLRLAKNGVERSMRKDDNYYPYWENAARAAEDRAVVWLIAALVLAAFPVGLLLVFVIRSFSRGKKKFETELFPKARDRAEEAIRVRARRRWEKQHPGED